jgi:hypothetical protein
MLSKAMILFAVLLPLFGSRSRADDPSVNIKNVPLDQEITMSVKKGHPAEAEYRIDSGTEEISGDPISGQQGSYDSWKKACAEWKKEMREMNGKTLITLSCGTPRASRDKTSLVTQASTGSYKIKVRIRESETAGGQ